MKRKVMLSFCLLLLIGCTDPLSEVESSLLSSSEASEEIVADNFAITPVIDTFDFDLLNDLEYTFYDDAGDIAFLSGHNIVASDYEITDSYIRIKRHYLVYLTPGEYELDVYSTTGQSTLSFVVLDKNNEYRVINHSFEMGDLFGWEASTIFKGERNLLAFTNDAVVAHGTSAESGPYSGNGDFLIGPPEGEDLATYEEKIGMLKSSTFTLGGSGYITFNLGVGRVADLAYLSIYRASDNFEIARYSDRYYHREGSSSKFGYAPYYKADLSAYLGEKLYAILHDCGGHSDDYVTFDYLETYHDPKPSIDIGGPVVNEVPTFALSYAPNQLPNGDFSLGLEMWNVSPNLGWQDTSAFHVEAGILKSNANGDAGRGLIRSSLFTIDGAGYVSLQLGAAKGARFDKDTYVSVRLYGCNTEIIRFTNDRSDGTNLVTYYVDLTKYLNKVAYFEVVDNATGSWDTIFVSDIKTYYEEVPDFTGINFANNLMY